MMSVLCPFMSDRSVDVREWSDCAGFSMFFVHVYFYFVLVFFFFPRVFSHGFFCFVNAATISDNDDKIRFCCVFCGEAFLSLFL